MSDKSLYERLGGYDAIAAVANALLPRLKSDDKLHRYWDHRGNDGVDREKQLLVDFLANAAGGPMYYTGRDMKVAHAGMSIDQDDWQRLIGHVSATLDSFNVPERESGEVLAFIEGTRSDIVD